MGFSRLIKRVKSKYAFAVIEQSAHNTALQPSPGTDEFLESVHLTIRRVLERNSDDLLLKMALDQFSTNGKQLRARLVQGLGQALGCDSRDLVSWAAAGELLHNATLVHDDLQDGDHWRRGGQTAWKKFGPAQAINLGDFLILIAGLPLLENQLPDATKLELSILYTKMAAKIVNGQSFEFEIKETRRHGSLEQQYMRCIALKTSAFFAGMARGTAVHARCRDDEQTQIEQLFLNLGAIFQIQDDILDLFGDKKREGAGCDIKEGKISYLVVVHLKIHPEDAAMIWAILDKPRGETTDEDVQSLIRLFQSKGTLNWALNNLSDLVQSTLAAPILSHRPPLEVFFRNFLREILRPIRHLREWV